MTAYGYTAAEHDAEQALVGIALLWPDRFDEVALEPGRFGGPQWRAAWAAVGKLRDEGVSVDPITVADRLEADGITGVTPEQLSGACIAVVTPDNAEHYAAIVRQGDVTRRTLRALASALSAHEQQALAGDELLTEALKLLSAIDSGQPDRALKIGEIVRERMVELGKIADAKARGDHGLTGITTGVSALDDFVGGYQRGIVTIVAGRPGTGKSSLAMTSTDVASEAGHGVHVFSLEDTRASYCDRAISRGSRVPAEAMRAGRLSREELSRLMSTTNTLRFRERWIVDDRSGIDAEEIVRSVRRARRENDTQLVIVDYVQLLRRVRGVSQHESLSQQINTLADAAKQDDMAYLVLSQLSRSVESRDNPRPRLSDLRESGTLEERAKCVLMLYREHLHNEQAADDEIEIIVRKNSNGRANGCIKARWDGATTRIW